MWIRESLAVRLSLRFLYALYCQRILNRCLLKLKSLSWNCATSSSSCTGVSFLTVIVLTLVSPPCIEIPTFSWHHWVRVFKLGWWPYLKTCLRDKQAICSPNNHHNHMSWGLEVLQTVLSDISSKFLEFEMPSLYNLSAMNCKFSCVLHWHVSLSLSFCGTTQNGLWWQKKA